MQYNCKVIEYEKGFHVTFYSQNLERGSPASDDVKKETEALLNDLQTDINNYIDVPKSEEEKARIKKVSMNRSKNNLYRIARSNHWDYFITLTFDREKVDSSDYELVQKKLKFYLNNLRKKNKELKYLFVPEFHKDGVHFHFHGLLSNVDGLIFKDSGHKDFSGNVIYNIVNWSFGFSTATEVTDSARVSSYISKYISKEMLNSVHYGHRYYASRNCNIAEEQLYLMPYDDFLRDNLENITYMKSVNVPLSGQIIKYFEIEKK